MGCGLPLLFRLSLRWYPVAPTGLSVGGGGGGLRGGLGEGRGEGVEVRRDVCRARRQSAGAQGPESPEANPDAGLGAELAKDCTHCTRISRKVVVCREQTGRRVRRALPLQ